MVLTKSSPGRELLAHHIYSANKCALYLDRLKNMHMHYINCNFEAGKELLADNSKKSTLRLRLGWSECSAACACVVMSSYDNGTFHHWENLRNKANHFTLVNKILDLDNLLIEKFVPKKVKVTTFKIQVLEPIIDVSSNLISKWRQAAQQGCTVPLPRLSSNCPFWSRVLLSDGPIKLQYS